MRPLLRPALAAILVLGIAPAGAADFTVTRTAFADEKAVFATVESEDVVPARARIGGTVGLLSVKAGDHVAPGQVLAVVADDKLLLQIASIDAQMAGLHSSLVQAQADLTRSETLFRQGFARRA